MTFKELGLSSEIYSAVIEKGYEEPTPIQLQAIPAILNQADILACAQTGTGKTAAFTLPMLDLLSTTSDKGSKSPRGVIIAPTRELAAQIHESLEEYGKNFNLRTTIIYGGVKANRQIKRLGRGVDILVATPGRLLNLFQLGAVKLNKIEVLVLDEADRMLDMGFIKDIKKLLSYMPPKRQNLLFSATFSKEIEKLAKSFLNNPIKIDVVPKNKAAVSVTHKLHPVAMSNKSQLLSYLIRKENWTQAIIFCKTKHGANRLVKRLAEDKIKSIAIHGNKSQNNRIKALASFKEGRIKYLVATDIASRGLDIPQMPQVVNFDLPNIPEDYVHRIGRTGRAGCTGNAVSLVSQEENLLLANIEKVLNQKITCEIIDEFKPNNCKPRPKKAVVDSSKDKQKTLNKKVRAKKTTGKKLNDKS